MGGKFLVILIGGFIIYILLKKYFRNLQQPDKPVRPPAGRAYGARRCKNVLHD